MEVLQEVFIPLQGFPLYEISQYGNIRNVTTKNIKATRVSTNNYIAVDLSKDGNSKTYLLHRLIAIHFIPNPDNKQFVDHINGVKTDNRPQNLRWVTKSENNMNQKKQDDKTSKYKGVYFNKRKNKWQAQIKKDGKWYGLRLHNNEKEAAQAYNDAAIEMFGEYAKLNEISDDE